MPKLSDTMEEGVLVKWHKHEGDPVSSGDVVAEVETDKAVLELEAYTDGVLRKTLVDEGARVPVGTLLGVIAGKSEAIDALLAEGAAVAVDVGRGEQPFAPPQPPESLQASVLAQVARSTGPAAAAPPPTTKASPLARKLAEQRGVDLRTVQGTGPGGRIVERDVEAAAVRPAPAVTPTEGERREPLSLMRATIARRMAEQDDRSPFLCHDRDRRRCVAGGQDRVCDDRRARDRRDGVLVKAMGEALAAVPRVNASFAGDAVVFHAGSHVGVAVALEDGIITPVVRDADKKSVGQIAEDLADLTSRARRKALKPEEYQGAGVSLSNLGMFRVDDFAAIITPPEAAVLAVGRIVRRPLSVTAGSRPATGCG
jgi:pyruvate dehydrogenase E2 component (dihydrolipoamide acetyltransferase)